MKNYYVIRKFRKTITYTQPNSSGQHGTTGHIYGDGEPVRYGDGRDGQEQYAPVLHRRQPGAPCSFVGCTSGRRLRGEVVAIERHTTGATTVTLGIGYTR